MNYFLYDRNSETPHSNAIFIFVSEQSSMKLNNYLVFLRFQYHNEVNKVNETPGLIKLEYLNTLFERFPENSFFPLGISGQSDISNL